MSTNQSNIGREADDASLVMIREQILGPEPSEAKARIGFMMASLYFTLAIRDAEAALKNPSQTVPGLPQMLKLAFSFASSDCMQHFEKETRDVLNRCTENFRTRYEPLLERLEATIQ